MESLGDVCLGVVCGNFERLLPEIYSLPPSSICDIFYHFGKTREKLLNTLKRELSSLSTFLKLLNVPQKRKLVLWVFQTLSNHDVDGSYIPADVLLAEVLALEYLKWSDEPDTPQALVIKNGMLLGDFLYCAGWFNESARVLIRTLIEITRDDNREAWEMSLKCIEKLIQAQSNYNMVNESYETYKLGCMLLEKLQSCHCDLNFAKLYNAFSIYFYSENKYSEALQWSLKALKEINKLGPDVQDVRLTVDVFRQAGTCCSVKRELEKARLLVTYAVCLARDMFGKSSAKYADALMDYGFYLLSSDNVYKAVEVYLEAVMIFKSAFGDNNLLTAISMADLAYCMYVREYNTGKFTEARHYSEKSLCVMNLLLPKSHLILASAKRVLALILEEIAIDNTGSPAESKLLLEAEALHTQCLQTAILAFGERNVNAAKHYGNLGRLYQTMKKFELAEAMHLKAISIKEDLLGSLDYEVALSIGHLASLYNYDLHQHQKAEELHLRSIQIGLKLFGEGYSGLEYDYRGLLQVYLMTGDFSKYDSYSRKLAQWKTLQDMKTAQIGSKVENKVPKCYKSTSVIIKEFFDLSWVRWSENAENAVEKELCLN